MQKLRPVASGHEISGPAPADQWALRRQWRPRSHRRMADCSDSRHTGCSCHSIAVVCHNMCSVLSEYVHGGQCSYCTAGQHSSVRTVRTGRVAAHGRSKSAMLQKDFVASLSLNHACGLFAGRMRRVVLHECDRAGVHSPALFHRAALPGLPCRYHPTIPIQLNRLQRCHWLAYASCLLVRCDAPDRNSCAARFLAACLSVCP